MKLAVLFFSAAVFTIFTAIFSGIGKNWDLKQKRLREIKNAQLPEQRSSEFSRRQPLSKIKAELSRKKKASKNKKAKKLRSKKNAQTESMLELAGLRMSAAQFSGVKLGIAAAGSAAVFLLTPMFALSSDIELLCYAGAIGLGLLLPGELVKSRISKKRASYLNELPDIMDLLSVSVEAGLGFDAALARLYEKSKSPLMEEFMRAQRDIHHGISKKVVYGDMSTRCGIKELTAFLNALLQAEEMGVSIRSVLKVQSEVLREARRQKAEEKALKAPVTMLLPMVIFIFPVIFIVLLGPAAMNLMESF